MAENKRITLENCVLTFTIEGVAYTFDWVNTAAFADPRENVLSGSPQQKGDGIAYRTGLTLPVSADFVVRQVPTTVFKLLKGLFDSQEFFDIMAYDKTSGDQYDFNNSIVRTNPSNANISEGEESQDVMLNASCVPNNWKHTPPADT